MSDLPIVDLRLPESWRRHVTWVSPRAYWMGVVAFSPRSLMFGVEIIGGEAKGLAVVIGPLWLGIAALTRAKGTDNA